MVALNSVTAKSFCGIHGTSQGWLPLRGRQRGARKKWES